jgi:hypothetical protein
MNVTDMGDKVLVYGEPDDLLFVVSVLKDYGAELIQLRR